MDRTLFASLEGHRTDTGVLAEFAWSHDEIVNVTTQSEKWFGAVDPARSTTTARITAMTYDGANRLETEIISDPVSGVTNTTYSYDHANNRSGKTVTGGTEPGHWTYTYNKSNQLTAWEKRASDAVGAAMVRSTTLTYDDNGNRLNQTATGTADSGGVNPPNVANGETKYTWDNSNRLASVQMPDGKKFEYTYDYRMRRVGTAASGTAPAKHTAIVFSGGLSVAEYEGTAIQPPVPTGTPLVQYRRGPDMGGGVGGMLYSLRSGTSGILTAKYSTSNGRGDIVAQSDEAAALTWTASYEAHGRRTKETGTNEDKQRANSKDEDPTGLLNEGFRYRDLETGVWLSRDPAGFVDGPNVYAYVKQNPWTSFDPNGLFSWKAFGMGVLKGAACAAAGVAIIAAAPVLLSASAATAVTAAVITVGVASTAVTATEAISGRQVEFSRSGVGLGRQLTDEERSEAGGSLLGGALGGGLTAKFGAPKIRGMGNPQSGDQGLVNSLVSERASRVAEGTETGEATFSVAQSRGQTTAMTESAKGAHAESQSVALARSGNAPVTVAVDQMPCTGCMNDVIAPLPGGSRVVVPASSATSTGSPKTAARNAASDGGSVVPRTLIEKPYTQTPTPASPPPSKKNDED